MAMTVVFGRSGWPLSEDLEQLSRLMDTASSAPRSAGQVSVAFVPPHYLGPLEADRGWAYFMARSLRHQGLDLQVLEPLRLAQEVLFRVQRKTYRNILNLGFDPARQPIAARSYARQIERQIAERTPDVVLSVDSTASALLRTELPIVLWLDATFDNLIGFYPGYDRLSTRTSRNGHALERAALERCALALYSSKWAADRAVSAYGVSPERVEVVNWGANLERHRAPEQIAGMISARPRGSCRLVFVGTDWDRKGGPEAVAIVAALNQSGLRAELAVIGCRPRIERSAAPFVRTVGYLDKATDAGGEAFDRELAQAHLLLLPTRADCTPLVIAEAGSFGVPTLAASVGGISEMIEDRSSGCLFQPGAEVDEYRDCILELMANSDRYRRLATAALEQYRTRLNWAVGAATVEALIRERVLA